jgi:glycosyltransferase involved in cell wall biosynthesis
MTLSVILTTYNSPEWLQKVLWGYGCQQFTDFEVVIADDGSSAATAELIGGMRAGLFFPVNHIWHEDIGFRKCTILNKAITAAAADYLVFSDGDCIPRSDFLSVHAREREPGFFLSGGYFKLPMSLSRAVTREDIESQACFDIGWLKARGLGRSFRNSKLTARGRTARLLNRFTPTNASWNGHNASGWKKDIVGVNGFDERMRYGALDREMGERLVNSGVAGKQIRYSAVCLHLDHSRGYVNEKDLEANAAIRRQTREQKRRWTDYGIAPKDAASPPAN